MLSKWYRFRLFGKRLMLSKSYRPTFLTLEDRVQPSFVAPLSYYTGSFAHSVAVADFNGDGVPDLAVANEGTAPNFTDGSVSVLLGNGDGTFRPAQNFSAGVRPTSVAVGDFNGDGIPDVVVTDGGDNLGHGQGVSVLLGNGDGTFQAPRTFSAGDEPWFVAVGDFRGAGILDLAVANTGALGGSPSVSVLLGNGDGTFQAAQNYGVGTNPLSVAVGDFRGAGILDLAVADAGDLTGQGQGVSVLLGNGDGTFRPARTIPAGSIPESVAVGDFRGNGILDLAVANLGSSNVSVLLGNGDGTFRPEVVYAAGITPSFVTAADLNRDGHIDLITSGSVLLGNGDGTFGQALTFSAAVGGAVAVGDFNGDGLPDLAVADLDSRGGVSVLLGSGAGTFGAGPTYPVGPQPAAVAVGDLNGDGIPDLVVANRSSNDVSVLLGNGDGTFQAAVNYSVGAGPISVALGDFRGDGILDIAVADISGNTVSVLLGNGDGSFQPQVQYAVGRAPVSITAGDFRGDGHLDLATANFYSNTVSVLLSNGNGTFQNAQDFYAGASPRSVAAGDVNGDGTGDLVVADQDNNQVAVLLSTGDGTFQTPRFFNTGVGPSAVVVGDFQGNGILDLALANGIGGTTVSVLLGNGDGSFQAHQEYDVGFGMWDVVAGDVNGDGAPDLAVVEAGLVRVLLGNGDGTFRTTNVSYLAGSVPDAAAIGDFNGDGLPDVAVVNQSSGTVSILLNDGAWPGGAGSGSSRSPGAHRRPRTAAAAGDLVAAVVARLAPSAAAVPLPGATGPLAKDSQPLLGIDVEQEGTRAAGAAVSATQWPALTPVWARAPGATHTLDRLFAEPGSGWLGASSADEAWCLTP
jgi:hypothetical protein